MKQNEVDLQERKRNRLKNKENELRWEYLNVDHFPFSYHGFTEFIMTALRGIGKSVIAMETIIKLKRKYGYDNVKAYWFRTAESSVKEGLKNNGAKLISQFIIDKYDLKLTRHSNQIFDDGKPLVEVYALTTAGKTGKGVEFYDPNFIDNRPINPKTGKPIKRFIVTVWDEFLMAEGVEKKSVGDQVEQYLIYRESIYRDQQLNSKTTKAHKVTTPPDYDFCYNLYLANNVSECAEVTGQLFNYVPAPSNHKVVLLTRKHAVFWNVPPTKNYKEKHNNSVNGSIINTDEDPNYAIVERDLSYVKPKKTRLHKPGLLLKFGDKTKAKTHWFILWDGLYIKSYHGEMISKDNMISMIRHNETSRFDSEFVKDIFEAYDEKEFMYADLMSMYYFKARMRSLKAK